MLTILLFNKKKTILSQSMCVSTSGYFLIPFITNYLELTKFYLPKSRYLFYDA